LRTELKPKLPLYSKGLRADAENHAAFTRRSYRGSSEKFPKSAQSCVLELLDIYGVESYERERERVQLAILKLSEGNEEKLREFVAVAKRDYRDVLFWAENPEARLDTPEKRERMQKMFEKFGIKPPEGF
jgi:hypothetical protein